MQLSAPQLDHIQALASRRVAGHSLAALRCAFGLTLLLATARYFAYGWIDSLYVHPSYHFSYWGFSFVRPGPALYLYAHFFCLGLSALFVALGLYYRVAIVSFFFLFAYVELLDVTTYLNHYYAVLIFAALLCFMPAESVLSLDRLRWKKQGKICDSTIPFVCIFLLRAQLGLIYFFAGLAKLNADWLLRAQPITIWLHALSDQPIVSFLLQWKATPYLMSIAGALFDLTIALWLSYGRTRIWAYGAVICFHLATWLLFPIGIFPWLMIALTPIFFEPNWPTLFLGRKANPIFPAPRPVSKVSLLFVVGWLGLQILIPLRHYLYPGHVLDTEQGFRWSWQVMIAERQGHVSYRIVTSDGRVEHVSPASELTRLQLRMMATQPDLILAYAHHLRDKWAKKGHKIQVFADAFVSTNGHPNQRFIDPKVDLAAQEDTLWGYSWLLTSN